MTVFSKWYGRVGTWLLTAMLVSTVFALAGCSEEDEVVSVTILHTTDVHHRASGVGPQADYTPLDTSDSDPVIGGYARLAAVINRIQTEQEAAGVPVLLLDSGDVLMGTVYDMTVENPLGLAFVQAMGYDAITLGNHEFDWAPSGLAMLLTKARAAAPAFAVPIVASNLVFSEESADDDALEALADDGAIVDKLVVELDNGLKVGLIGLMGEDADDEAPTAPPVTFDHTPQVVLNTVADLYDNDGADMVVALSHSGVNEDLASGEDIELANLQGLEGLNVIASGHTHVSTPEVIEENGTVIFQPGAYGNNLGRLDIRYNVTKGEIEAYTYEVIAIDDTIEGDDTVQAMVDAAHAAIDPLLQAALGVTSLQAVAELSFAMDREPLTESGLGNLVADSVRNVADAGVGVIPNGVVRDELHESSAGQVTFSDIYNVLPLGMSPAAAGSATPMPGWPLVQVYLTPYEIRNVCEVSASIAASLGDDSYINYAGMRCEYDPTSIELFNQVNKVTLCDTGITTNCNNELNISNDNGEPVDETLHKVVSDLYTLLMMGQVAAVMYLVPKFEDGTPVDLGDPSSYMQTRVDADPGTDGIQEIPSWMALFGNIKALPVGDTLPEISEAVYGESGSALGRLTPIQ